MITTSKRLRAGSVYAALALLLTACGDKGVTQAPVPAHVTVTVAGQLRMGGNTTATATITDAGGAVLTGQAITWRSSDATVASVNAAGIVTGVGIGSAQIEATVAGVHGASSIAILQIPVSVILITGIPSPFEAGLSALLTATAKDSANNTLSGRVVTWESSDTSRAKIDNSGMVTAIKSGTTTITARSDGATASFTLTILPGTTDFSIDDAQWTQGVQAGDGSIPMILDGGAAVVNVLLTSNQPAPRTMQFVLRLFDANGTMYRADTVSVTLTSAAARSFAAPSAQFLVPADALKPGMSWQLVRDPRGLLNDTSRANDVLPRAGRTTVATRAVPPLNIRFVPIVLSAHGNTTGQVSSANLAAYLQTLRSVHPVGVIQATIGNPFTTSASFGVAPAGGDAPFWQRVLSELDLARVAAGAGNEYWIGVVAPPAGFNNTSFGGFGYIPTNGSANGPGTRTSVLVNVGWFSRPTQSRDLVAHELGHNFGRLHAPCGGAGAPIDLAFPNSNGVINRFEHDVYSWSAGLRNGATTVDASTGDVMGYCFPVWSSEYTYRAVLDFRGSSIVAGANPQLAHPQRVLVVRGTIDGEVISLMPTMTMDLDHAVAQEPGDYVVEGVSADGRVLFAQSFRPFTVDHSEARPFTVLVPVGDEIMNRLVNVSVRKN